MGQGEESDAGEFPHFCRLRKVPSFFDGWLENSKSRCYLTPSQITGNKLTW